MSKLNRMQKEVNGLLSIFTKLIEALKRNITELDSDIQRNKATIVSLEEQNVVYSEKIDEYKALAENVKGLLNRA